MAEEQEMTGYKLAVSFPDQSPSFCYGFEAGKLWERMESGTVAEIEMTTRIENREVIARCADYLGWSVDEVKPSATEGWDFTKLTKTRPAGVRDNPHGLRIVQ